MKAKFKKGLIFFILQLIIFYIFPLLAGPTEIIALVLVQFVATFVLSFIVGAFSISDIKFVFPVVATLAFIPVIMIYMNNSAYIYLAVYAVITVVGVLLGTKVRHLFAKDGK